MRWNSHQQWLQLRTEFIKRCQCWHSFIACCFHQQTTRQIFICLTCFRSLFLSLSISRSLFLLPIRTTWYFFYQLLFLNESTTTTTNVVHLLFIPILWIIDNCSHFITSSPWLLFPICFHAVRTGGQSMPWYILMHWCVKIWKITIFCCSLYICVSSQIQKEVCCQFDDDSFAKHCQANFIIHFFARLEMRMFAQMIYRKFILIFYYSESMKKMEIKLENTNHLMTVFLEIESISQFFLLLKLSSDIFF